MAAIANALALVRFAGLHFGHFGGRGGSDVLFLIGLAFAAGLVWVLCRPRQSTN